MDDETVVPTSLFGVILTPNAKKTQILNPAGDYSLVSFQLTKAVLVPKNGALLDNAQVYVKAKIGDNLLTICVLNSQYQQESLSLMTDEIQHLNVIPSFTVSCDDKDKVTQAEVHLSGFASWEQNVESEEGDEEDEQIENAQNDQTTKQTDSKLQNDSSNKKRKAEQCDSKENGQHSQSTKKQKFELSTGQSKQEISLKNDKPKTYKLPNGVRIIELEEGNGSQAAKGS